MHVARSLLAVALLSVAVCPVYADKQADFIQQETSKAIPVVRVTGTYGMQGFRIDLASGSTDVQLQQAYADASQFNWQEIPEPLAVRIAIQQDSNVSAQGKGFVASIGWMLNDYAKPNGAAAVQAEWQGLVAAGAVSSADATEIEKVCGSMGMPLR